MVIGRRGNLNKIILPHFRRGFVSGKLNTFLAFSLSGHQECPGYAGALIFVDEEA